MCMIEMRISSGSKSEVRILGNGKSKCVNPCSQELISSNSWLLGCGGGVIYCTLALNKDRLSLLLLVVVVFQYVFN